MMTALSGVILLGPRLGKYVDGKVMPISWAKSSMDDNTHYYDQNGNDLMLNPGKTMFEICNVDNTVTWE